MKPLHLLSQKHDEECEAETKNRHIALEYGLKEGFRAFFLTGLLSGSAVLLANRYSRRFANSLGVSGKLALAISPPLFAFSLKAEHKVTEVSRNPQHFGISLPKKLEDRTTVQKVQTLKPHHLFANYAYEHPFQLILGTAVPSYLGIFYLTNKGSHLLLSQKIMHTRVYGQGMIVAAFLGTMMFRDMMERRGGVFVADAISIYPMGK
mmetsp:Transcript_36740/g.66659  ORF Transcript_36740/g.66659 Transcript_36740/m.66659 type:complete len:207 (-) Transcript_36740:105-725(-)